MAGSDIHKARKVETIGLEYKSTELTSKNPSIAAQMKVKKAKMVVESSVDSNEI